MRPEEPMMEIPGATLDASLRAAALTSSSEGQRSGNTLAQSAEAPASSSSFFATARSDQPRLSSIRAMNVSKLDRDQPFVM